MGVGDGHCQQQAKRHKGRCQPLCRAGGAVLHVFHILCDFLTLFYHAKVVELCKAKKLFSRIFGAWIVQCPQKEKLLFYTPA